nr:hypothetical protein [Tanacetum cinerariifolium]
ASGQRVDGADALDGALRKAGKHGGRDVGIALAIVAGVLVELDGQLLHEVRPVEAASVAELQAVRNAEREGGAVAEHPLAQGQVDAAGSQLPALGREYRRADVAGELHVEAFARREVVGEAGRAGQGG